MAEREIVSSIRAIQDRLPEELVQILGWDSLGADDVEECFVRYLNTYSPVYLPILQQNADLICLHVYPGVAWLDSPWFLLTHDSESPRLLASSFSKLPYALIVPPINIAGFVEEIWAPLTQVLSASSGALMPSEQELKQGIDGPREFLAHYDATNYVNRISVSSKLLEPTDAIDIVDGLLKECPKDWVVMASAALLRQASSASGAVALARETLQYELSHGLPWVGWNLESDDTGPELLELLRPIAMQGIPQSHPLTHLEHASYMSPNTANVLKRVAERYRDLGEERIALNQLRNAATILGYHIELLDKQWCLDLAEQAERVEPKSLAAKVAYYAAEVIHLEP